MIFDDDTPETSDEATEEEATEEEATEDELMNAAARADRTGMFTCPHTGVALAAFEKLVAKGTIRKDHRVVVVSTAHGLKFSGSKAAYHEGNVDHVQPRYQNVPVELKDDVSQVKSALDRLLA